jgi:hypothetical protein
LTRQPDFSTAARSPRASVGGSLWLLAGVVALLLAGYQARSAREEQRSAEARLADVRRELATLAASRTKLAAQARARGGRLDALEAPPTRIVADLAAALPPDARLERLAIDYAQGGKLELRVVARDAAAWDLLLERLAKARRILDVEPGPESRAGEIESLVRARWSAER